MFEFATQDLQRSFILSSNATVWKDSVVEGHKANFKMNYKQSGLYAQVSCSPK